jgi:DNA-directed RNA polymerase specialized sigma24 family protein
VTGSPTESSRHSAPEIRPLTRRAQTGELYYRRPEVERQIAEALSQNRALIENRLRERDKASELFLKEECLVYLIRDFARRGDDALVSEMSNELTVRCMDFVKYQVRRLVNFADLEECRNEILMQTFERIYDFETDRADYLEVSFWNYLKRLSDDAIEKFNTMQRRAWVTDSFDDTLATEEGTKSKGSEPSSDFSVEMFDSIRLREALLLLPLHIRTAFIMHHLDGYQIESNDPNVPTLAKHFDKSPRMIRNWLAQGVKLANGGVGEKQ